MAVGSQQYTVGTTAVLIAASPVASAQGVVGVAAANVVINNTGAVAYLGGSNVTASNGLPVPTSASTFITVTLYPGDQLYAYCATSTVVSVLQT